MGKMDELKKWERKIDYKITDISTQLSELHDKILLKEIVESCNEIKILDYEISIDMLKEALDLYIQKKEKEKLGKDNNAPAKKTNKPTVNLLKDGTLIVNTDLYFEVKRVLVEHETNGTLYYADNERPKGKWLTTDMKGIYRCSECEMSNYTRSFNYCQNCGSKMEVE